MKKVIVFRHGDQEDLGRGDSCWSPDACLVQEGKEMIEQVARFYADLLRDCTVFVCSPLIRAQQSLFTMMDEIGYPGLPQLFDQVDNSCENLKTRRPETWYVKPEEADSFPDVKSIWMRDPQSVHAEGAHFFEGICQIMKDTDKSALCVSHAGMIDAGMAYAKSMMLGISDAFVAMKDVKKGQGVVFCFEDARLVQINELRDHI